MMALYARVENGATVERRHFDQPPPAHKAFWRPVVDNGLPAIHAGQFVLVSDTINADNVTVTYTVQKRPDAELRAMIKQEAQRRIVAMTGATDMTTCLTKQLNAVMRATELTNKKTSGQTLSDAENAEAGALQALATAIKAIRSKSDSLEVSLPTDFDNNAHWS